nr:rRNA adenine N-6-methyltransferase family protein [Parenemella sanctibonifatiensis]
MVGNIPFHLTTPILRRLLTASGWRQSVLLTQWEVARKRAGVGGGTLMTAQAAPWFVFRLHRRVDAGHFRPRPSVDGGILSIQRRNEPLVPVRQRRAYGAFVRAVFTGRGGTLARIIARSRGVPARAADRALAAAGVKRGALPRDLTGEQWSALWVALPVQ